MSFLDRFRTRERTAAAARGGAEVERAPRAEWRALAPIETVQRSTGSPATVDAAFGRQLTTARAPSFLDDLGHIVTRSAPSGLISGLAIAGATTASDPSPAAPSPASSGSSHMSVMRRIEYGPSRPATIVSAEPPAATLLHAPSQPVQRRLEPATPVAVRHEVPADANVDSAGADVEAPLLGATDPPMQLTSSGRAPDVPSGDTGELPTPARQADHAEHRTAETRVSDPAPPAVVLSPIQRAVIAEAGHHRRSDATEQDGPSEPASATGTDPPATAPEHPTGVVPILSRSLSTLPTHPRIGGPIDPSEHTIGSTNPSAPAPESVRSATESAHLEVTRVDATDEATQNVGAVASSSIVVTPSEPPTHPPDARADDAIAPLAGALPLWRLVTNPTPAGPEPAAGHGGDGPGASRDPLRTWTPPTPDRLPSSPATPTPTPLRESASTTAPLQRQVTDVHASSFETADATFDSSTAVVRPTVGRDAPFAARLRLSAQRDSVGTTPVALHPPVDTASTNPAFLQRADAPVPVMAGHAPDHHSGSSRAPMIPPSIAQAVAFASEVTPLGRAALDTLPTGASATAPGPAREVSRNLSPTPLWSVARSPVATSLRTGTPDVMSTGAPQFVQRSVETGSVDAGSHNEAGRVGGDGDTFSAMTPEMSPESLHAEADWLPVQTAPDGSSPARAAASPTAGGTDRAGGSPFSGASEADVIGLLRTMYPHLRRRLSRDLLLERDRAGHRTDIRF